MKSNAEEVDGEHQSVRCQRGRLGSTSTAVEASQPASHPACLMGSLEPRRRQGKARQGRARQGKARQSKARAGKGKQGNKLWGTMYQYSPRSRKSGSRVSTFFHLAATSHQPGRQSHLTHASTRLHATCSETLRKNVDFMPTTHRQCHSRGAVSTVSVGVGVDVSI
jgi:hypothetical protein